MILIYPDPHTGEVCHIKAGTYIDLQVDKGSLTVCVDTHFPGVALEETFAFHANLIDVGLITATASRLQVQSYARSRHGRLPVPDRHPSSVLLSGAGTVTDASFVNHPDLSHWR